MGNYNINMFVKSAIICVLASIVAAKSVATVKPTAVAPKHTKPAVNHKASAKHHTKKAIAAHKKGNIKAAKRHARKVLHHMKKQLVAHAKKAKALKKAGKHAAAKKEAAK